jgi:hypothetical protein
MAMFQRKAAESRENTRLKPMEIPGQNIYYLWTKHEEEEGHILGPN